MHIDIIHVYSTHISDACTYTHICVYAHVCIYIHTCTYIYQYTHTHTNTHTNLIYVTSDGDAKPGHLASFKIQLVHMCMRSKRSPRLPPQSFSHSSISVIPQSLCEQVAALCLTCSLVHKFTCFFLHLFLLSHFCARFMARTRTCSLALSLTID